MRTWPRATCSVCRKRTLMNAGGLTRKHMCLAGRKRYVAVDVQANEDWRINRFILDIAQHAASNKVFNRLNLSMKEIFP